MPLTIQQQEALTVPLYKDYRSLVPPLSEDLHKGQGGRIGILGGSSDYTGAPYFSAMAALRLGADLAHVICDEDAATAIKSYSPDIIVHPYIKIRATSDADEKKAHAMWMQTFDDIGSLLKRIHVLVIGPGLSRDKGMLQSARHAIEKAKEMDIPIVIDADGLFLIQNEPELIQGYKKAILTPNLVEFERLCKARDIDAGDKHAEETAVQRLSRGLGGVIIVQKGSIDLMSNGEKVHAATNDGGLKRSGGQGDVLTGIIATSLAWGVGYQKGIWKHSSEVKEDDIAMTACFGACLINRQCSQLAFKKHGRAMQASDVLEQIGPFFEMFYERATPRADWAAAIYG
ncbi:ATP-dependent NAD(P)H-hydrate dehydratase [Entomortierella parvispora]|uniref:ATP-dependent (S)-NAD(P)H-hydrate dehydratase n=1 Tax=Entomortierella parvispora TaxID=205924 RepID=A0A9P3H606_9FUNG|nr:ATP-dependent NAD(P)H-hydrate dehydratase [Entomortierella parvispora]